MSPDPSPDLDDILTWLLRLEDRSLSGVTVNLNDGGGLTRLGVTQTSGISPDFFTEPLDAAIADAKKFYKTRVWDELQLNLLPMPLAASVLSCAVNCGNAQALRFLKFSGNDTQRFISRWKVYYAWLVGARPQDQKFLKGWYARAEAIYPTLP